MCRAAMETEMARILAQTFRNVAGAQETFKKRTNEATL